MTERGGGWKGEDGMLEEERDAGWIDGCCFEWIYGRNNRTEGGAVYVPGLFAAVRIYAGFPNATCRLAMIYIPASVGNMMDR